MTCDDLDQNKFITRFYSTLAMKNHLMLKKQQVRGCGNLLLATTLAPGCGVTDRYGRLSRGHQCHLKAQWASPLEL